MEARSTIVILIDALGFELAERHGFHPAGLPQRARLRTILGFSQAALTTMLTGRDPADHGLWMMYSFAQQGSPFSWLRAMPGCISSERLWLRNAIRWALERVHRVRSYYSLYSIPRSALPYLDLPSRERLFAPRGGGEVPNIFDFMEHRGLRWQVWDFTVPEEDAFNALERSMQAGGADFYLLYTSGLDSILHRYGTRDERIASHLNRYQHRIERIVAKSRGERIIVLGDHGMCDVTSRLDLLSVIDSLDLEAPRDFVPFYDSTLARFRVRSEGALEKISARLSRMPNGRLLTEEELRRFGVFFTDGRFGDAIFLANPGTLILPSFMGKDPVAAMHGYDPGAPCMDAVAYANVDLGEASPDLRDMAGRIVPGFRNGDAS
jgi:hypothetical protein